jgi:hypothetical protein
MRPILDTADSGHAPNHSGQRFWTHTNRTPIGTGPQSERPILDAPILDTHQSEPDVIQEVIQGSNSE